MAYIGQEPGLGQAQRSIFTATAVTDTVTADDDGLPLNYTVGQVSVYLNGVKQVVGDDVVASNGSTLVFDDDYAIGDVIEVIALSTFSPADTVPTTGGTFSGNIIVPTATASGHAVTKAQLDASGIAGVSSTGSSSSDTITVAGHLTVNGTTTTINSTTLTVDDKNIELAHSPSGSEGADAAVDGGGITLKSSDSDKEIKWVNADDAWTFNQHLFPSADNASDLGSAAKRWRNVYTTDLHLANERGNWTVIEEEDYLTLRNNKTDKVYKLVMEEIE